MKDLKKKKVVGNKKVGVLNKDLLKATLPLLREILNSDEYDNWFQKEKPVGLEDEVFLDYLDELCKEKK